MRICSVCKIEKNEVAENFQLGTYKNGKNYWHSICKDCNRLKALEYVRAHKEERKAYTKNFIANNPTYIKTWKLANKEKINERERERCATDINFKLKKNVSRAIGRAITKNGNSTFDFLPYTAQELKNHLENQFDDKMNWENYGNYWHIDHIVPHSTFQYTSMKDESFTKCWALSNLRPLDAKQNQSDEATRIRHKG